MQYQVYKEDTGEMVAWIDPESIVQIVKNGYAIKCGENLKANESEDEVVQRNTNREVTEVTEIMLQPLNIFRTDRS